MPPLEILETTTDANVTSRERFALGKRVPCDRRAVFGTAEAVAS